jgi:hypothetical protein
MLSSVLRYLSLSSLRVFLGNLMNLNKRTGSKILEDLLLVIVICDAVPMVRVVSNI